MRKPIPHREKSRTKRIAWTAALCAVALLATPAVWAHPPQAHKHHPHKVKKKQTRVVEIYREPVPYRPVYTRRARLVVAPQFIPSGYAEVYRPYLTGRVYYGPHRHYHTLYHFPAYRAGRYSVEPHHYCSGHRTTVTHVAYDGPRISFGVRF